jgi:hypothetical protein
MLLAGEQPQPGWVPVAFSAMAAFALFTAVRSSLVMVTATPDELIIRNQLRTHRVPRADIAGFGAERSSMLNPKHVYVELRDGDSIRMLALERQFPLRRPGPLESALDRLEAWRTGAPRVAG